MPVRRRGTPYKAPRALGKAEPRTGNDDPSADYQNKAIYEYDALSLTSRHFHLINPDVCSSRTANSASISSASVNIKRLLTLHTDNRQYIPLSTNPHVHCNGAYHTAWAFRHYLRTRGKLLLYTVPFNFTRHCTNNTSFLSSVRSYRNTWLLPSACQRKQFNFFCEARALETQLHQPEALAWWRSRSSTSPPMRGVSMVIFASEAGPVALGGNLSPLLLPRILGLPESLWVLHPNACGFVRHGAVLP